MAAFLPDWSASKTDEEVSFVGHTKRRRRAETASVKLHWFHQLLSAIELVETTWGREVENVCITLIKFHL